MAFAFELKLVLLLLTLVVYPQTKVYGITPLANVGVNYGRLGSDLPPPAQVINFLANVLNNSIPSVRLFDPNVEALAALSNTSLQVTLGCLNQDLAQLATSLDFARNWVNNYVLPYAAGRHTFKHITVGNEVIPGPDAGNVLPAIKNMRQALLDRNLTDINVTTVVSTAVLGSSFPPSSGQFANEVAGVMNNLTNYLYSVDTAIMINVYPYFAYASDPEHIQLDYALFTANNSVVVDQNYTYYNLFDAMVDSFDAALARAVGKNDSKIIVSESGWPSSGNDPYASIDNARTYNNNLKQHIQTLGHTPRRPDLHLDTFIFALFNENQKPQGVEQHFGSFYPNFTEVYPLWRS